MSKTTQDGADVVEQLRLKSSILNSDGLIAKAAAELSRLRTENERLREALTLAEAVLSNAPEFETTAGGRIPLTKVSEARDVARAALKEPCGWPDEFDPEAV